MPFLNIIILTAILTIGVLFACKPSPYQKEIAQIDSLLSILHGTEQVYSEIDTGLLKEVEFHVKTRMAYLETRFDTLPYELAIFLSHYSYPLKKSYKKAIHYYKIYGEELQHSQKQLQNLKHDLKYNLIEKTKALQYLEEETQYVLKLIANIENLSAAMNYARHFPTQDSILMHKIDSLTRIQPHSATEH